MNPDQLSLADAFDKVRKKIPAPAQRPGPPSPGVATQAHSVAPTNAPGEANLLDADRCEFCHRPKQRADEHLLMPRTCGELVCLIRLQAAIEKEEDERRTKE